MKITSAQNDHFKFWKELKSAKAIRQHKQFFLMGEKLTKEFLKKSDHYLNHLTIVAEIIPEGLKPITNNQVKKYELTHSLHKELDVIGTHFNLLLIQFSDFSKFDHLQAPEGLEIIAPVGDPGNMGALIRSALAFNVKKIILTKESCHPFHPRALKASAGACLQMSFAYTENSFSDLPLDSHSYFLDQGGQDIFKFDWPKNLRLWIGEEGPGISKLSQKHSNHILSIPTHAVESLNVTVAASIAISEWNRHALF